MATTDTQTAIDQISSILKATIAGMDTDQRVNFEKEVARLLPLKDVFNGHKNYETWIIALYIDNSEATQAAARGAVEVYADTEDGNLEAADVLRHWFEVHLPEVDTLVQPVARVKSAVDIAHDMSGAFFDILSANLEAVDWRAIVRHVRGE